jgi:hypothetical protein
MRDAKTECDTVPPSAPDARALAEFESDVRERGEDSARWPRHIARLASLFEGRAE